MPQLTYLIDEISAGMEVYYTSRTGGRFIKTSYILCDDFNELISKLFLVEKITGWNDKRSNGSYKSFREIINDAVNNRIKHCSKDDSKMLQQVSTRIKDRRKRRNDFFHSTHLLDLSVNKRGCIEAYCDMISYGELLFSKEWKAEISARVKLEILCTLFKLENKTFNDPTIEPKINSILQEWPRREQSRNTIPKKGTQYAQYPEDMHLRLCLDWGGVNLKDKLFTLLNTV